MGTIQSIPEVSRRGTGCIRIPPGVDVPLTERVRKLIDASGFRRLAHISQLGLVRHVYPGATHSRQEHSLGVFLAAIEYLDHLGADPRFEAAVSPCDAELLLAAALLHDVGHWPFGHPIEDLGLADLPHHESLGAREITSGRIAEVLRNDWRLEPCQVANLVCGNVATPAQRILRSILSGPIDVDKIDYLQRDSLHAGVPYGQHFDRLRLIGSLCLNEAGDALAITEKGKTAAEMMVFARYVMFSEVYWHHTVRAATAMLQRAVHELHPQLDFAELVTRTDEPFVAELLSVARGAPTGALLAGIFGPVRSLYKRLAQYSFVEEPTVYELFARRPYGELVNDARQIASMLGEALGQPVAEHEVLVDAPPTKLEVAFDIDVYAAKKGTYHALGDLSPVVRTLAQEQFDKYVKRVRVFIHPRLADAARSLPNLTNRLKNSIAS